MFSGISIGETRGGDVEIGAHSVGVLTQRLQQIARRLHAGRLRICLLQAAGLVEQQQEVAGLL
jgi:hypothetical protein